MTAPGGATRDGDLSRSKSRPALGNNRCAAAWSAIINTSAAMPNATTAAIDRRIGQILCAATASLVFPLAFALLGFLCFAQGLFLRLPRLRHGFGLLGRGAALIAAAVA